MDGWIKLHRSLLLSRQFAHENELKVWIWLSLKASSRSRIAKVKTGKGFRSVALEAGQMIFGRISAEKELNIDQSTIYRIVQRFKDYEIIRIDVNSQFSIITLLQWSEDQASEEEEFFEIEDERTGNEQAMNTQRTGNEQAMSGNWSPIERQLNTNNKVNNSKEGEEGLEGEEGGLAPAMPGAFDPAFKSFVLEADPAKPEPTPSRCAAPSPEDQPPKPKRVRKPPEGIFARFNAIYDEWMKREHEQPAEFGEIAGTHAKAIIKKLRGIVDLDTKTKNVILDEPAIEERILAGWAWFLSNWNKIDPFYQDKLKLQEINSNFTNAFNQAKNGTAKERNKQNGPGGINGKAERAAGAMQILDERNRRSNGHDAPGSGGLS